LQEFKLSTLPLPPAECTPFLAAFAARSENQKQIARGALCVF
jgi:hypothetical protein